MAALQKLTCPTKTWMLWQKVSLTWKNTSKISRNEFYARHSESYVEENFGGSLPAFLAAFGERKKLKAKEIDEIKKIIESMRG